MKIERDKFYRTREGKKARVLCTDATGLQPIIAQFEGESPTRRYYLDGRYLDATSSFDLVAPWIDKPLIDRSILPAWANKAVAMDEGGVWFCYAQIPDQHSSAWHSSYATVQIPASYTPNWTGDWKHSLVVFED